MTHSEIFRRDFRVANFGICEVRKTPLKKCSNPHTNIKPRHISTPIIIIELKSSASQARQADEQTSQNLSIDAPYKKQEWILTKITNVIDGRSKSGGRSVRCVPYGVGVEDVNNMYKGNDGLWMAEAIVDVPLDWIINYWFHSLYWWCCSNLLLLAVFLVFVVHDFSCCW